MKGVSDDQVMKVAIDENRTIVTMDRDFVSELDEKSGHEGIILFTELLPIGKMIQEIQKAIDILELEDIRNTKQFLP